MPVVSGPGTNNAGLLLKVREQDSRTLSDLALELIHGDRAAEYAPPEENLTAIGAVWGVLLRDHVAGEPIPAWRVALLMAALKIVRAGHKPGDDSLIDSVGYIELVRRLRPDAE